MILIMFKGHAIARNPSRAHLRDIANNKRYFTKTDSPYTLDTKGNRFEMMQANPGQVICERCRMSVIPLTEIEDHVCIPLQTTEEAIASL